MSEVSNGFSEQEEEQEEDEQEEGEILYSNQELPPEQFLNQRKVVKRSSSQIIN